MTERDKVSAYKELIVWQKSIELAKTVYAVSGRFPKEEQFGLTAQLRRAAVSVSSNIAEGSGRATRSEYARFLAIARGSCFEVETQLILCREIGFCSEQELVPAFALVREIGRMLNTMIRKLS